MELGGWRLFNVYVLRLIVLKERTAKSIAAMFGVASMFGKTKSRNAVLEVEYNGLAQKFVIKYFLNICIKLAASKVVHTNTSADDCFHKSL